MIDFPCTMYGEGYVIDSGFITFNKGYLVLVSNVENFATAMFSITVSLD